MENVPKYVFWGFVLLLVAGLVVLIRFSEEKPPPPSPVLQGAGSTFVNPLMVQWSSEYERTEGGCRIEYRSLGSQAGINFILDKRADFGCSDAPMTDAELARAREAGGEVIHIPLVLGAVVPVYNLEGVKEPLRFTGETLADIYLGKIKKWNHSALRDLNPGVTLPDRDIQEVHRRDGSGTTYIWVDYLSKVSPEWKKRVGVGTEVKWPAGVAEVGNEGVAEKVQKTPGSIGYVELAYAYRLDLAFGWVQNREKEFVKANLSSVTTAAANALMQIPDDLRYSLTDPPGKGSYPIAGTTWALVRLNQPAEKGKALVRFLSWATGEGQDRVKNLFYARLPEALVEHSTQKIAQIKVAK